MKFTAPPLTPERLYLLDKRWKDSTAKERELELYLAQRQLLKDDDLGPYLAEARSILFEMATTSAQYRERRMARRLKKIYEKCNAETSTAT